MNDEFIKHEIFTWHKYIRIYWEFSVKKKRLYCSQFIVWWRYCNLW